MPQLDYADIVWDAGKKKHADRLQKLQNRAVVSFEKLIHICILQTIKYITFWGGTL